MDGSSVSDAQVAADIWRSSQPNAPTAYLAFLHRNNLPFPVTGIPATAPNLNQIVSICKPSLQVQRYGFEYFQVRCPRCKTMFFVPATEWGMRNLTAIANTHQSLLHGRTVTICDQRLALNKETTWPDSLEA